MGLVYGQLCEYPNMNECFMMGDYLSNRLLLYNDSEDVRSQLEYFIHKAHAEHKH